MSKQTATSDDTTTTYRVIQWATGGIGKAAIAGIVDHPQLELVGCWVHSADKVGVDAGALAGIGATGVAATNDVDAILAMDADCILYGPAFPNPDEVERMLRAGKSVVTPTGWIYPKAEMRARMQAACEAGGATLHGTGIHPGGFTERMPLQLTAMQRATSYVRSEEFSDIRTYGAPDIVGEMMMFGKTPEDAKASPMGQFLAAGFYESIQMIADELQMELDGFNTVHEIGVATAPIDSPIGVIEPGRVAAQRFTWQGMADGKPVIEAIVNWLMGEEHLDVPWKFGEHGVRYEVSVHGDPDLHAIYHGMHPVSVEAGLERNEGIVATAMHCVNSIPYVCAAGVGVKTYLDLPMYSGRAAPALVRKA